MSCTPDPSSPRAAMLRECQGCGIGKFSPYPGGLRLSTVSGHKGNPRSAGVHDTPGSSVAQRRPDQIRRQKRPGSCRNRGRGRISRLDSRGGEQRPGRDQPIPGCRRKGCSGRPGGGSLRHGHNHRVSDPRRSQGPQGESWCGPGAIGRE